MNLASLIAGCEARTGYNDSSFQFRWRAFLNEALREYARANPWPGLESSMELLLPAGARYLTLPEFVEDVLDLVNTTDSISITRRAEFGRTYPATFSRDTQGQPWEYDLIGDVATVHTTLAGYVWFRSTHASDTDFLYFTGIVRDTTASGTAVEYRSAVEEAVATGQTPVSLTNLFVELHSIAKASQTNGDFYFFDTPTAAGGWASFIPAAETEARFKRLQFHFVPSAAKNLRMRYRRRVPTLTNSSQSPPPGVDSDYLVNLAVALFQRSQGQYQKGTLDEARADRILNRAANKAENWSEPAAQIVPYRPDFNDPSSDWFRP